MRHRSLACFFLAALILSGTPAIAQTTTSARIPFVLSSESNFQEGCLTGTCLCPVFWLEDLRGRFTLIPERREGSRFIYRVRDLHLRVPEAQIGPDRVTGYGTYWTDRLEGAQRMQLELSFDGEPFDSFDSGVVPFEGGGVDVTVITEGIECFGNAFQLVAHRLHLSPTPRMDLPEQPKQPDELVTWGTVKSRFR